MATPEASATSRDRFQGGAGPILHGRDRQALAALQFLIRSSHLGSADDLPSLVDGAATQLGAERSALYVVDYDQVALVPLAPTEATRQPLHLDGTLAGRCFRDVDTQVGSAEDGAVVWVPVVVGAERLGVLELEFPHAVPLDTDLLQVCEDIAGMVAGLLMTLSPSGDAIELARRRKPLTLPAELQWRLLPPLSFVSRRVSVAGNLVPSTEVAGDSFDYSINGDVAHVAIIDAMGHGIEATLLSAVAIGALRNGRRAGMPLAELVLTIDAQIASTLGPDKFVTGIFGELDLNSGVWTWTTCGHPPALLVRDGHVVKRLDAVIGAPLGLRLLAGQTPQVASERLQPGDRLLLYTDGVIEARDEAGRFFGIERFVDYVVKEEAAGIPAAEALRRLNQEILRYQFGEMQDDATTVMVEWLGDDAERTFPE